MNKDLEILRKLLSEADEEETTEETPKEDEKEIEEEKPKKGSFEEDPMGFILKKYHSLNELMEELMTPAFKEYVDGIFIMAPKPTTFKILLHNGQYFFLTYLGVPDKSDKAGVYEATIEGKRYYLAGIGETERCMVAIARLLRFGTPLKTKGPEGAEQSTRDNTGMEGDWAEKTGEMAAGGEAGAAAETPETGEEPAGEELQENLQILKRLLIREANEPEADLFKALESSLGGKKDTKKGKHIRANIGGESDSINAIDKAFKSMKIDKKSYEIEAILPNEFSKGAKSGSFNTYKITLLKDIGSNKEGSEIFIVSTVKEGKTTITGKALTPAAFGLEGNTYKTTNALVKQVQDKLNVMPNKQLANTLSLLVQDISNLKTTKVKDVSSIKGYSKSITLSDPTQQALSTILPGDIDKIGVDFGEVLGAILMSKEVNLTTGIYFPNEINAALTDFAVDGYGISSKYKKGASATLTKIISEVDPKNLTTPGQIDLYNSFKSAFALGVSHSYLQLAKKYTPNTIASLANAMKIPVKSVTIQNINEYIAKIVGKKPTGDTNPGLDKKIKEKLQFLFTATDSKPSFPINWGKFKPGRYYGLVLSPIATGVAKKLNSQPKYLDSLKEIVGKVEVKQLYLDFNLKSNSMSFKLKSFTDPSVNFVFTPTNMSVYTPENGKMGFTLK